MTRRARALLLALCCAPLVASAAPPAAAVAGDVIEVDLRELTGIDWQPGDELPDEIADLDGREVVLSGYMQEQFRDDRATFLIVPDSCQCAGRPLPHHFVEVTLDEETGYRPGVLTFLGELSVGEVHDDDGFVESLYRLEGRFF